MFVPVRDKETRKWRIRKNNELESLLKKKKKKTVNTIRN
jgi:hypothetical protein